MLLRFFLSMMPKTREKHLEKKMEELVVEAKAKMAKNDKKGTMSVEF
jgi:hypothetical protein